MSDNTANSDKLASPVTTPIKFPSGTLNVASDSRQPASAPVLLTLTINSTGKAPIRFWWSGPADYPDAGDFVARVKGGELLTWTVMPLSNGQHPDATGRAREIVSGSSVHFPAALAPLPAGTYEIVVGGGVDNLSWDAGQAHCSVVVELSDDKELKAARDKQMLERVRENDAFAQFVSAAWSSLGVRDELIKDLMGENIVVADRAASGLWFGAEPPVEDAAIVADAIIQHLSPTVDGCDLGLMEKLLKGGSGPAPNDIQTAASCLAVVRENGRVRSAALAMLKRSSDYAKEIRLPRQLPAPNGGRGSDPVEIARHDTLIQMLKSHNPDDRVLACTSLGDFPDSDVAIDFLRRATDDDVVTVRNSARSALIRIANYQYQNRKVTPPAPVPIMPEVSEQVRKANEFASVLSAMKSKEAFDRVSACMTLAGYPHRMEALDALSKALHDSHIGVRIAAQRSLDAIQNDHKFRTGICDPSGWSHAMEITGICPQPASNNGRGSDPIQMARHDAMIDLAESGDPSEREWACNALADFPESRWADGALHKAARDPDATVRAAAIRSLDNIDSYFQQRSVLRSKLNDPGTQP